MTSPQLLQRMPTDQEEIAAQEFFEARGSYGAAMVSWEIAVRMAALYGLWLASEYSKSAPLPEINVSYGALPGTVPVIGTGEIAVTYSKSGDAPDANCKTLPNGDCVAVKCMHSPEETPDLVKCRRCGFVGKADILPEGDAPAGTTPDAGRLRNLYSDFTHKVAEAAYGEGWGGCHAHSEIIARVKKLHEWSFGAARASSAPPDSKLTTYPCECGRKYLVEGKVIGIDYRPSPPAGQGQ